MTRRALRYLLDIADFGTGVFSVPPKEFRQSIRFLIKQGFVKTRMFNFGHGYSARLTYVVTGKGHRYINTILGKTK